MAHIDLVTIAEEWDDGRTDVVSFRPGAGRYILSSPELLDVAQCVCADLQISKEATVAALQKDEYDDIDLTDLALAILLKFPREVTSVLHDTPVIEIQLADGTVDIISRLDLLRMGLHTVEGLSIAWSEQHLLASVEWACGQAGRTWVWDPRARRVLWETDEVYGTAAKLPNNPLFVVYQCYSTYATPPTHFLLMLRIGNAVVSKIISLDNTVCETKWSDNSTEIWSAPFVRHRVRDPESRSYQVSVDVTESQRPRVLTKPLYWDESRGLLYIFSSGLYGADAVFAVPLDDLLVQQ